MKVFVEILKIIGLSAVVLFLVLYFSKSNHLSCSALEAFDGESSLKQFFALIQRILIAGAIWLIGLITYFVIKKKKRISLLIYFPLLSIISLHAFIFTAATREAEKNRSVKQQLCSKATDDGMILSFVNLDKSEYDFIHSKANWLPVVPNEAALINIEYYRDDFLGDFDLHIKLKLKPEEKLDTIAYAKWKFDGKIYHYKDFQN